MKVSKKGNLLPEHPSIKINIAKVYLSGQFCFPTGVTFVNRAGQRS
jgi:hypothetical protein